MDINEKAKLLDWIARQERLRIEAWYSAGARKTVYVWTISDDEDSPSGRGRSVLEALKKAKKADDGAST